MKAVWGNDLLVHCAKTYVQQQQIRRQDQGLGSEALEESRSTATWPNLSEEERQDLFIKVLRKARSMNVDTAPGWDLMIP